MKGATSAHSLHNGQLFRTTDDGCAEVVLTYGERVESWEATQGDATYAAGFDARMAKALQVSMDEGK